MAREPNWDRVKDILHTVLERPREERASLMRQVCGDDTRLRAEVESLLAAHEGAGGFAERPALQALAESDDPRDYSASPPSLLQPGDRLGPYEIQACLGRGGMGEVYRAADPRLQRLVAVKVLRSQAAGPQHRERFEREARVIARLLHPHICVLHDIGSENGHAYLVMEYLDGETLADRLDRGALPVEEAIRYAIDLAEALIEIHRNGIVHRDIKPSNIMLTSTGAKLLDFGVAKQLMIAALAGDRETTAELRSATLSSIFGTPLYMAPEQRCRGEVDHRTDIFAFGAVLYEMVTGRKAFPGDTVLSQVIAVREIQPPEISSDGSAALQQVDRVVRRCLAANPADRWQSMADIKGALTAAASLDRESRVVRRVALMGASAALAVLAASAIWLWPDWFEPLDGTSGTTPRQLRLALENARLLTGDERVEIDPVFSPDGSSVAYASGPISGGQIRIKSIDGGPSVPINPDGTFEYQPRWSPDGTELLYIRPGGVFIASPAGGRVRRVVAQNQYSDPPDLVEMRNGFSAATWSPDGRHLAVVENIDNQLVVVSLADGRRRVVAKSQHPLHSCNWSPDGRWIACTSGNWVAFAPGSGLGNAAPSTIVIVAADGGELRDLTDRLSSNQSPTWAADSRSLYFVSNRSGTFDIYALAISSDGTTRGAPARMTTGLGAYSIAMSNDGGRLAYAAYSARANVWSMPIPSDDAVDISSAEAITTGNQVVESVRVSRDGKWVLYDSNLTGDYEIFRVPVGGGRSERLTFAPSQEFAPDQSKDGRHVAYHSWRTKSRDVFVQPLDGGPVEQVTNTPSQESYPVWSPDGRSLLFFDQAEEHGAFRGIFVTQRDSTGRWGTPTMLRAGTWKPSWSPDGRSVVYTRLGNVEILSFDSNQSRVVFAKADGLPGAQEALMSEDGRTLYFKAHDANQMAQIWSVPAAGGAARLLVRFTDPARRSNRSDFAVGAGRLYFTIDERRSNVWLADIREPVGR